MWQAFFSIKLLAINLLGMPCSPTIRNWYCTVNGDPGCSNEALLAIQNLQLKTPFPIVDCMSIDAMSIKKALQSNVHLYRTVWWIPESNQNQSMNFYLIDPFLAFFLFVLLGRRFWYCILIKCVNQMPKRVQIENVVKYIFFSVIIFLLGLCCLKIYMKQGYNVVIYLCYPIIVYIITFGFEIEPFLRTVFESDSAYMNGTPLHCCSTNPITIRTEIDALKKDFNNRFKQVIFTSLLNAYYSCCIPCCFAQKFLFYDVWVTTSHMAFVVIQGLTMCTMFCFPANYCDVLHRAALHLGCWNRIENRSHPPAPQWSKLTVWPNGSLVKYSGDYYRSNGLITTAIPSNSFHNRFYAFFQNPSHIYMILTSIQVILVMVQLILLFCTTEWHNSLSLGFLLLSNYYTLFKMIRDLLVTHKIYGAESAIYTKIITPNT